MKLEVKEALAHKLLAMADNELILGHRNSEWTGHAPILEEDIAFANIALDEIGHAKVWYTLLADLRGEDKDTYPDQLVFFREAADYRNIQLVELPIGDWAFSMLRQYLFDAAELVWLRALSQSGYRPLAEATAKIRKEELYHFRHTHAWLKRLGLGTAESWQRMQEALVVLWPYTTQLFQPLPDESVLIEAGFVPEPDTVRSSWEQVVLAQLAEADLVIPADATPVIVPRDEHTPHLAALLTEMQEVARYDPQAEW
jgi:ring-1,2-phenylacetyl-CoA epoxidase subunit PaaC